MACRRSHVQPLARWRAGWGRILAIALAVFVAGCHKGPPPPPTYPATGQVVYRDGRPVQGGIIEFRSEKDSSLTISADIAQDGGFTLSTIYGNRNLAGAIEGRCQVTVTPAFRNGELPEVIVLVEPTSILPQTNRLTITIPKTSPK